MPDCKKIRAACSSCCKAGEKAEGNAPPIEETDREYWGGRCDALLSYIGYCVGLGNVWRFPYLCYRNGGGAFVIPYLMMLAIAGIPLYFLELALGQYASLGATTVWAVSPFFKGVGMTAVTTSALCCLYYNVLIAYILFYLFASMTSELPWASCDNEWNTPACVVDMASKAAKANSTVNGTLSTVFNVTRDLIGGEDENMTYYNRLFNETLKPKTASEEYWERYVLELSPGIDHPGKIRWHLALTLLLAWIIVFLCLLKGIKTTGKVVYVTATFPYIVLTILLIRGATLEGAKEGLLFYVLPKWEKLLNPKVWGDAASQVFYSLGPAWGILLTYGSYNRFNSNCHRDSIISTLACAGTSLYAGLVIFSVIGFMAHELQVDISEVMTGGPGLVFVVYPAALSRMPIGPLWAIIFFCMLLTIALDSMFATFETFLTAVIDEFPTYLRKRRTLFTGAMCALFYLASLPQVTQGGFYLLTLQDWYIGTFPPLIIGFLELIIVSYVYGYKRFAGDIETMLGFRPAIYWRICWTAVAPAAILFIIVFNAVIYTPVVLGNYVFPKWAEELGWLQAGFGIMMIPLCMIYMLVKQSGGLRNSLVALRSCPWDGSTVKALLKPTSLWRPAAERNREAREATEKKLIEQEEKEIYQVKMKTLLAEDVENRAALISS